MPEKIKVKTGKPSDATCIAWEYKPNELEKAKATATEFFDNVTRIWTLTTHEERTHQHGAPFLFAYIPKGKRKQRQKPQGHKNKQDKRTSKRQPEQSRQGEGQKAGKEMKRKAKGERQKDKREANTQQAFNPPNYSRVQKPHKPRKARKQHKPTRNAQNPLKTP